MSKRDENNFAEFIPIVKLANVYMILGKRLKSAFFLDCE